MTLKSFTDVDQSKNLAKILPAESADMCYRRFVDHYNAVQYTLETYFYNKGADKNNNLPCWSLAALLRVLPQTVRLVGTSKDSYWYCECVNANNQWYAGFGSADNPVDACYEMIVKLHELKML